MTIMEYPLDLSNVTITVPDLPLILTKIFPEWVKENITVKPVSGGITNMLIKCTHLRSDNITKDVVLARSYGSNTNLIIDRTSEFKNHLLLHKLHLAPSIYAQLSNGIIYGFLSGRSLTPEELAHVDIYPLISQKLGYWHTLVSNHDTTIAKHANDLWSTIDSWIDIAPNFEGASELLAKNSNIPLKESEVVQLPTGLAKTILKNELKWLRKILCYKSKLVKSHCDLLSGNIVIPPRLDSLIGTAEISNYFSPQDLIVSDKEYSLQLPQASKNPVAFIDYEYMLCAARGFDIANHLAEWQGFRCDKLKILKPSKSNLVLRRWCYAYLAGTKLAASDEAHGVKNYQNGHQSSIELEIDSLIDEVYWYYGMPGFYWGIWAAIQNKISTIDFDYGSYCVNRLSEYYAWKADFLSRSENN